MIVSIDDLKKSSREVQIRASGLVSVAFDNMKATTAVIDESEKVKNHMNSVSLMASHMVAEIVRGNR